MIAARDNLATLIAIGLLAYASADIAHHVLGHGGACLASGGHIRSLSSIYVDCTKLGTVVDLGGPVANLLVGVIALVAVRLRSGKSGEAMTLFLVLAAAFNLFWFFLPLVFSVLSRTDDWAWPLHHVHASHAVYYGLAAAGALGYWLTLRMTAASLSGFANPVSRVRRVVWSAWLTGGVLACVTALFDRAPVPAILHHAAPQSFALAIGLLLVPQRAAGAETSPAPVIGGSIAWIAAAALVAAASIICLGPGFAV